MPSSLPLFRPAAVRARGVQTYGKVVLAQPLSFAALTLAAGAVAAALAAFLLWGSYTEHSTLSGRLMPNLGVLQVRAPQYGVIVDKRVAEGERVARGDVLYVISSDRANAATGSTQASVARTLASRSRRVRQQIADTRALATAERTAMRTRLTMLERERRQLRAGLGEQEERVDLAARAVERYAELQAQGFVSRELSLAKRRNLLDQRARLASLRRERTQLAERIADARRQRAEAPLKTRSRIADLQRSLARIREESIDNEARRRIRLVAPAAGTVTAVLGELGQTVDSSRVLASILPDGAKLQAELAAPSRAVGFIDVGDRVLLRYRAYPYQKFGHRPGTVVSVSRTVLSPAELGAIEAVGGPLAQPKYRITVALDSQTLTAGGRTHRLKAGMGVDADVLEGRRRLYEWMLEPLYGFRKRP